VVEILAQSLNAGPNWGIIQKSRVEDFQAHFAVLQSRLRVITAVLESSGQTWWWIHAAINFLPQENADGF
jgi:hypothetical protein